MEQENNEEIIEGFRKRKKKQLIITAPLILAIVGMVLVRDMEGALAGIPVSAISGVCTGLVFAGILFSVFNWRCPACNAYLGKGISPKFCRRCGAQLQ